MRTLKQDILLLAENYTAITGRSEAYVSKKLVGRSPFLRGLREGRNCWVDTAVFAIQWFSDNWPEGRRWPRRVPRPKPSKSTSKPGKVKKNG